MVPGAATPVSRSTTKHSKSGSDALRSEFSYRLAGRATVSQNRRSDPIRLGPGSKQSNACSATSPGSSGLGRMPSRGIALTAPADCPKMRGQLKARPPIDPIAHGRLSNRSRCCPRKGRGLRRGPFICSDPGHRRDWHGRRRAESAASKRDCSTRETLETGTS